MHFYDFNIGEYAKKTAHLTNEEDIAYRRAIDLYYDTEKPLDTQNIPSLSRRLRVNPVALKNVIDEFFPDGINKHCEEKIATYYAFINKQKANGLKGGRPKRTQALPNANPKEPKLKPSLPTTNLPLTTNQNPETNGRVKSKAAGTNKAVVRASRLPSDWALPKSYGEWALQEKPLWSADDVRKLADIFADHWRAASGKGAAKLDWLATWRNWVRKEPDAPRRSSGAFATAQQQRDAANKKSSDDFVNGNLTIPGTAREVSDD